MEPKTLSQGSGRAINVLGDNITLRLTAEDTGGAFTLVEQNNPPGVGIPLHFHTNEEELFHVVEGTMDFTIGDQVHLAVAGTTVFLPRNLPHAWKVVGETPARTLLQVFPAGCEGMWEELSELGAGAAADDPPDMGRVVEIANRYGVHFPRQHP